MEIQKYQAFIDILRKELIPAVGCTEPTAIALVAARTRELLGCLPERVEVYVSGDIIKNAKSAVVPNTGGRCGIRTAVAAGVCAGMADRSLEVLSDVTDRQRQMIVEYLDSCSITVALSDDGHVFEIDVKAYARGSYARVKMQEEHTNIVYEEKDGEVLYDRGEQKQEKEEALYAMMNVADIVAFADALELTAVSDIIRRQIQYNGKIAEEGLRKDYGANIGKTLLALYGEEDVRVRAKARAAAGSDARMSGSILPVIVVSGSGNQGITATVPVVEYAKAQGASEEMLIRAVALSDLFAIYLKHGMGKLSAFCGALCAGIGAACGIAYLKGGRETEIAHTIVNAVAVLSGMICDGAKPSCAAKIAAAVDSAIFGYEMYLNGQEFLSGDGIISENADKTIENIAHLGSVGLKQADWEILQMMLQNEGRG
ncbi:MAG: L-serine ammonia-lyase, iron-sulfur-dependent, subunit alpha [Lachnospiraceae bacterium]|nr:L-serine ammonia-lyase, iron-sulfur-dependent, subunit alpha [Lachnospiraceae bacterium]